jgi:tetratricopeptide (TPR) repeat protein
MHRALCQKITHVNVKKTPEVNKDSITLLDMEKVMMDDPYQIQSLLQASSLAAGLCGNSLSASQRAIYTQKATIYAERSIQVAPTSKEAHLNYIVSLGLLAEIAKSPSEKLKHAKTIKKEADYLISVDSLYPPAYYALGKWHLSLASLSWLEKAACDFLYGGMPAASLETALHCFEKAIQLRPDYILFHYNKALALHKLGRSGEASKVLKYSLQLPILEANDVIRKNSCIALLNEL